MAETPRDLLIHGGRLVTPQGVREADILIRNGTIVAIAEGLTAPAGAALLDAGGKLGQLDAWRMEVEGSSGAGSISIFMVFVPYGNATFRITGMALSHGASKYRGRFVNTARSFRPLTPAERSSIQSMRLRVVKARPGESLVALGRRTGNAWDPSRTAVYNGLFVNHRFEGGELVKIAHVEAYVPRGR